LRATPVTVYQQSLVVEGHVFSRTDLLKSLGGAAFFKHFQIEDKKII
jgi:hypothetical protein